MSPSWEQGNISHNHIQVICVWPTLPDRRAGRYLPGKSPREKARYNLTDARVYESHEQMLASEPDIDIVDVCTPPYVHAEISINALNAGCHVLKPMAASLEECDAMIAAQQASGKLLAIIAQNRFTDAFWRLKRRWIRALLARCAMPSGLVLVARHCYYDLWWRGTGKRGRRLRINHAVHHIDAIQWMLGFPSEVVAMMTNVAHDNAEVEDLSAGNI